MFQPARNRLANFTTAAYDANLDDLSTSRTTTITLFASGVLVAGIGCSGNCNETWDLVAP